MNLSKTNSYSNLIKVFENMQEKLSDFMFLNDGLREIGKILGVYQEKENSINFDVKL